MIRTRCDRAPTRDGGSAETGHQSHEGGTWRSLAHGGGRRVAETNFNRVRGAKRQGLRSNPEPFLNAFDWSCAAQGRVS